MTGREAVLHKFTSWAAQESGLAPPSPLLLPYAPEGEEGSLEILYSAFRAGNEMLEVSLTLIQLLLTHLSEWSGMPMNEVWAEILLDLAHLENNVQQDGST